MSLRFSSLVALCIVAAVYGTGCAASHTKGSSPAQVPPPDTSPRSLSPSPGSTAAGAPPASDGTAEAPAVEIRPQQVELGEQVWGGEAPFELTLVNHKNQAVTIERIISDCDCLFAASHYEGTSVPTGGILALPFRLRLGEQARDLRRSIEVRLQSGERVTCWVHAKVVATYALTSGLLAFGDVPLLGDENPQRSVRFSSTTTQLLDARGDREWVRAEVSAIAPKESEVLVTLDTQRMPAGANSANVVLTTDDPKRPQSTLQVTAKGVAALRPYPAQVIVPAGGSEVIAVFLADGRTAELASAASDEPAVEPSVDTDGRLRIHNAGRRSGSVRIIVTDTAGRRGVLLVLCVPSESQSP